MRYDGAAVSALIEDVLRSAEEVEDEEQAATPSQNLAEGGEQTLYQHSINFPPGDTKIGWCVFESKPGSKWTAELLKKKQDTEKKDWATQDVYEIMKPAGIDAHYK